MKNGMLAAVFEGEGKLILKEVPIPVIEKNNDVLIKVEVVSICGTDVHILEVPPDYIATPNTILGHEIAGQVLEIGKDVSTLKVGDRVVINPNEYDCTCQYCKLNLPNHCENLKALGIHVNGGFAKYCKVSEKVCYKISPTVSPNVAAFAEPLACVINGAEKVKVQPAETVLILGSGPIGLLFLKLFKSCGAKVIISELSEFRRKIAEDNGADIVVDPKKKNLEKIIEEETNIGTDVVVDATGSLMETGLRVARKGGRFLVFGVNTNAVVKIPQFEITFKELRVLGTWLANATFPKAVKIIESGILNLEKLITHRLPLEKIKEGIDLLNKREALKVMVNP